MVLFQLSARSGRERIRNQIKEATAPFYGGLNMIFSNNIIHLTIDITGMKNERYRLGSSKK